LRPTTVKRMIALAMEEIGALDGAFSEEPTAAETVRVHTRLDFMLGLWSASSLMVRGTIQEAFPLVAGQAFYTIGIGGQFNTSKPIRVTGGFVRDQYNYDTPITTFTKLEYDGFQDKLLSPARPIGVCYDPGPTQQTSQMGGIYVYYPADNSGPYTLFLEQYKALTSVGINDILCFEDPYLLAIMYCLAEIIWRPFHGSAPIPQDITRHAKEAKQTIKAWNHEPLQRINAGSISRSFSLRPLNRLPIGPNNQSISRI
jgi:hypothetical protein